MKNVRSNVWVATSAFAKSNTQEHALNLDLDARDPSENSTPKNQTGSNDGAWERYVI